ncbi:MAG: hypothetical protein E6R03_08135 [Hyphomicrobiaceae bacterium]|nr:MAG: hypothetical protein E6R03_08135 [Hyphomicrobiaceae bacterium]
MKAAAAQIDPGLRAKPQEFVQAQHDIAASQIYNALQKKGDRNWLHAAANSGSIIAGVLSGGQGTK